MRGDFTRDTFDPARHFSRVLMQQGRVQLDADLNEQTAILLHYLRTLAKDILGPYAGPADATGFEIVTSETPNWENRIDSLEPDKTRQSALKAAINRGSAVIAPGRYYVHGMLVESERTVLYDEQPVYAVGGTSTIDELKNGHGLLFYLDVWERHITYVEDDRIREVALGGVDSCSRAQIAWQVKVLRQDYGERPQLRVGEYSIPGRPGQAARTCAAGKAAYRAVRHFARVPLPRQGKSTLSG